MKIAGRQIAIVLVAAACLTVADTAFLFHESRELHAQNETLSFTTGFVIFQELLLFGSMVFVSLAADRASVPVPIRISYVTAILFYIVTTILTMLVFTLVLLPKYVSPQTYYKVLLARTGAALLLLALLYIVGVLHRAAHRNGETQRSFIESLVLTCDRARVATELSGWNLLSSFSNVSERIRFSEGLRQNPQLRHEVLRRFEEVEALARCVEKNGAKKSAETLLNEIEILATSRG